MLVHFDKSASSKEIKESLETGSNEEKADAMKKVISLLMNGEHLPQIFHHHRSIRFTERGSLGAKVVAVVHGDH